MAHSDWACPPVRLALALLVVSRRSAANLKPRPRELAARRDELGICAQVSLRYELPYLLSWVAHHTLLGFDRITLYLDDLKSSTRWTWWTAASTCCRFSAARVT